MKVAVLSDVHANIYALRSVLNDLDKEGVESILVAGDLIGYYYWPLEVVKALKEDARVHCIRGNHESILKETLINVEAAERYRIKYGTGYDVCREQLSDSQINWLLCLPSEKHILLGNKTFYLSHGSLSCTDEYLYPDTPHEKLLENYSEADYTIFGHTHYPFTHGNDGQYLINPGSVGQPRDIGGIASFVIIDTENNCILFKRKSFDIASVVSEVEKRDPSLNYLAMIMKRG